MANAAIVAGVGPTIGESTARALYDAGYDVGLLARSESFVADLAADLGDGAVAVPADVTDEAAVEAAVETVREELGAVEVLVLNASAGGGRPIEEASADRLRSIFDVRVAGSLALVTAVREDLEATGGTVLFSGTTYAAGDVPEQVEWGAVGPAAEGLATSLASAMDGVQVTYVRIGSRVVSGEAAPGALSADDVASTYLDLVERERVSARVLEIEGR